MNGALLIPVDRGVLMSLICDQILSHTAQRYGYLPDQLRTVSRNHKLIRTRRVAIAAMRNVGATPAEIVKTLGLGETVVRHGLSKLQAAGGAWLAREAEIVTRTIFPPLPEEDMETNQNDSQ